MKPEVRQAITWASRAHPALHTLNGAVSRAERYKKRAQDENAGEQAATAIKNMGIVIGVATVAALAITYEFSKGPSEAPKETRVVAASECDAYEQSVESLFTEAIGRAGVKVLFPSEKNMLSFGSERSAFSIEAVPDVSPGTTDIVLRADMRGRANQPNEMGVFVLRNNDPKMQQQRPGLMEWVTAPGTKLAEASLLSGKVIGNGNEYKANGNPVAFTYDQNSCVIAGDPDGLKPMVSGIGMPGVDEAAAIQVAALRQSVYARLPAGPAFS